MDRNQVAEQLYHLRKALDQEYNNSIAENKNTLAQRATPQTHMDFATGMAKSTQMGSTAGTMAQSVNRGLSQGVMSVASMGARIPEMMGMGSEFKALTGLSADDLNSYIGDLEKASKINEDTLPEYLGEASETVRDVLSSIIGIAPGIPAGFVGVLAAGVLQSGNQAVSTVRDRNRELKAKGEPELSTLEQVGYVTSTMAVEGAVTTMFQRMGVGGAEKYVEHARKVTWDAIKRALGKKQVLRTVGSGIKQSGGEVLEENIIEVTNLVAQQLANIDPTAVINEDNTVNWQNINDTVWRTTKAAIGQTGAMAAGRAAIDLANPPGTDFTLGDETNPRPEISKEILSDPDALSDWASLNPDAARGIANGGDPSRKLFNSMAKMQGQWTLQDRKKLQEQLREVDNGFYGGPITVETPPEVQGPLVNDPLLQLPPGRGETMGQVMPQDPMQGLPGEPAQPNMPDGPYYPPPAVQDSTASPEPYLEPITPEIVDQPPARTRSRGKIENVIEVDPIREQLTADLPQITSGPPRLDDQGRPLALPEPPRDLPGPQQPLMLQAPMQGPSPVPPQLSAPKKKGKRVTTTAPQPAPKPESKPTPKPEPKPKPQPKPEPPKKPTKVKVQKTPEQGNLTDDEFKELNETLLELPAMEKDLEELTEMIRETRDPDYKKDLVAQRKDDRGDLRKAKARIKQLEAKRTGKATGPTGKKTGKTTKAEPPKPPKPKTPNLKDIAKNIAKSEKIDNLDTKGYSFADIMDDFGLTKRQLESVVTDLMDNYGLQPVTWGNPRDIRSRDENAALYLRHRLNHSIANVGKKTTPKKTGKKKDLPEPIEDIDTTKKKHNDPIRPSVAVVTTKRGGQLRTLTTGQRAYINRNVFLDEEFSELALKVIDTFLAMMPKDHVLILQDLKEIPRDDLKEVRKLLGDVKPAALDAVLEAAQWERRYGAHIVPRFIGGRGVQGTHLSLVGLNTKKLKDRALMNQYFGDMKKGEWLAHGLIHELGHALEHYRFNDADESVIDAVKGEYQEYLTSIRDKRDDEIDAQRWPHKPGKKTPLKKGALTFEEWFADNVAKWSQVHKPANTTVERFFKDVANTVREWLKKLEILEFDAVPKNLRSYLDSLAEDAANQALASMRPVAPEINSISTDGDGVTATSSAIDTVTKIHRTRDAIKPQGFKGRWDEWKKNSGKWMLYAREKLLEEGTYINEMVKSLNEFAPAGVSAMDEYQALNHTGPVHAQRALNSGVFNMRDDMQSKGPSLKQIIADVGGWKEIDSFGEFLMALRAREMFEKNVEVGFMTKEQSDEIIAKHKGKSAWIKAARDFTEFNNNLIDMLVDVGVLSRKAADLMVKKWRFYAPVQYLDTDDTRTPGGFINLPGAIKSMRGSKKKNRPYMNPLQATAERATQFYERAAKQRVVNNAIGHALAADQALAEEAGIDFSTEEGRKEFNKTYRGANGWIKSIEGKEVPRTKESFRLENIMPQLRELGIVNEDLGMYRGEADGKEVLDALIDIHRPDQNRMKDDFIARVWVDGKPKLYQFQPDLFRVLHGSPETHLAVFSHFLAPLTRMVKLGATGLNPSFAFANLFRDYMTHVMYKENSSTLKDEAKSAFVDPLGFALSTQYGRLMEMFGKETNNVYVDLYHEMGGFMQQRMGNDEASIKAEIDRISGKTTKERSIGAIKNLFKDPGEALALGNDAIDSMVDTIGFFEIGPRMSAMKQYLDENGWTKERLENEKPPLEVLIKAINKSHDATVNFKRMGTWGRELNKMIPFFNAAVQSLDRYRRWYRDNPARALVATASAAAAQVAYWSLVKDEEWYQDSPPWLKYGYWTMNPFQDGTGPTLRIPRPFELGYINYGMVEGILETMRTRDPKAMAEWASTTFDRLAPPGIPKDGYFGLSDVAGIGTGLQLMSNHDAFRDTEIDTRYDQQMRPVDRYDEQTTNLAKGIARLPQLAGVTRGWSPKKIEFLLDDATGGLYKSLLGSTDQLYNYNSGDSWLAVGGEFLKRNVGKSITFNKHYSQSVQDFYREKNRIEELRTGQRRQMNTVEPEVEMQYKRYQMYNTMISEARDHMRALKTPTRKERFEYDKYIIGLSRRALGLENLDLFPDPLQDESAPASIREAVRKQAHSKIIALTNPEPQRQRGESAEDFAARQAERDMEIEIAKQLVEDLGLGKEEVIKALKARGYRLSTQRERYQRFIQRSK